MSLLESIRAALAGRYAVERELGHGGMAFVLLAQDLKHHRPVAIKVLRPELAAALGPERFLREIEIAARLTHPHILSLHDSGEAGGLLYYVMPYVEGESLRDRLSREQQLPVDQAVDIARQVASALSYAHSHDIVHRDIKPENILLAGDDVAVADFGVARAITAAGGEQLTSTGIAVGTPAYMSPEQGAGEAQLDGRSDIYGLGCVLYEMLAGAPPYTGPTGQAIMARRLTDPVPPLRTVRETVPIHVEHAVFKALAKVPVDRFATATQFAEALVAGLGPARSARRFARLKMALVAGVALVLVASAVLWQQASRSGQARSIAAELRSRVPSLAVLPLKNHSGDPAQEYFADGMTDELTTTLAKIEGLRVIAHRSVLRFKHSDRSVPEIARLLEVQHVLDGSVLQDGDRIRITANLIDAATNTTVWGERFERERRDILVLQREVALAIARAIEITLTPQDRERLADAPQVDPEAFDLYIKGTQARYKFTTEAWTEAADYFGRAIARDSGYAPAYAGLAFVHVFSGYSGLQLQHAFSGEKIPARRFAERALELDPHLADPLVVLGLIRQVYDWDWAGAEKAFRQAIRLNPGHAEAHHELSMLLMRQKRFDEAMREARYTLYLAPVSARFQGGIGEVYLFSGRYDEAVSAAGKARALDSSSADPYGLSGHAYWQQGKYGKAIEAWRKCIQVDATAMGSCRASLGYAYAVLGEREKALEAVEVLKARRRNGEVGMQSYDIAVIYAGLGEREQALEWLERTVEPGAAVSYLGIDPTLRSLHAEPRFQALLKKIGLEE